jgi:hypothetical protein
MSSLRIFIAQSVTVLLRLSWQPLSRTLPSTLASCNFRFGGSQSHLRQSTTGEKGDEDHV